jgi:hypothetical protein
MQLKEKKSQEKNSPQINANGTLCGPSSQRTQGAADRSIRHCNTTLFLTIFSKTIDLEQKNLQITSPISVVKNRFDRCRSL